jgi:hypothetical protein
MLSSAISVLLVALTPCVAAQSCGGSYLYDPAYCLDYAYRGAAREYTPQAGDIVFSTDDNPIWKVLFNCAGTGHPHHSAIAFARSDGTMSILESGPHDTLRVELLDPIPHLTSYDVKGRVWIRQRRTPLTAEESARLTAFAEAQEKRRFAMGRLGQQLTLLRARGPIRTQWVGGPHGNRDSYFCCELLMEACVAAGIVDPVTTRPSATFPRDVFFDRSINPWINRHLNLSHDWFPPARWASDPDRGNLADPR